MSHLLALKTKVSGIASYFDTSRRFIYIDYPLYANVGDLLINLGSEQFFAEQNLHIWRRYNQYDFPGHISDIRNDDVFLCQGGGNLGDMWEPYQSFRECILERYPHNRIIFLPQTVHFQSRDRETASMRKMKAHRNLHVFVRDEGSFERLQRGGLESVSCAPDMAHALLGVLKPTGTPAAGSELHFIRRDKEGTLPPLEISVGAAPVDWDRGIISQFHQLLHRPVLNTVKGIGRYLRPIDAHRLWYWHRDRIIHDGLELFSRYETVVTNRLHAMLLGLLLGRNVLAWDNSYGKLSSYYQLWLSDVSQLRFYPKVAARGVAGD